MQQTKTFLSKAVDKTGTRAVLMRAFKTTYNSPVCASDGYRMHLAYDDTYGVGYHDVTGKAQPVGGFKYPDYMALYGDVYESWGYHLRVDTKALTHAVKTARVFSDLDLRLDFIGGLGFTRLAVTGYGYNGSTQAVLPTEYGYSNKMYHAHKTMYINARYLADALSGFTHNDTVSLWANNDTLAITNYMPYEDVGQIRCAFIMRMDSSNIYNDMYTVDAQSITFMAVEDMLGAHNIKALLKGIRATKKQLVK